MNKEKQICIFLSSELTCLIQTIEYSNSILKYKCSWLRKRKRASPFLPHSLRDVTSILISSDVLVADSDIYPCPAYLWNSAVLSVQKYFQSAVLFFNEIIFKGKVPIEACAFFYGRNLIALSKNAEVSAQ